MIHKTQRRLTIETAFQNLDYCRNKPCVRRQTDAGLQAVMVIVGFNLHHAETISNFMCGDLNENSHHKLIMFEHVVFS